MNRGTFYCYQIPPVANLMQLDWLIEYPARDWEFELILSREVWMVQYDANHPDMQTWNRSKTCYACGFSDVVFDDDIFADVSEDDFPDIWQADTLVTCP